MAKPTKTTGGFTALELLIVVGMIGILAAILLPVLDRIEAQSKSIRCLRNLQQIGAALQRYQEDWDGRLIHHLLPDPNGLHHFTCAAEPGWRWGHQLEEYLPSKDILICPSGKMSCGYFAPGQPFWRSYEWNATLNGRDMSEIPRPYSTVAFCDAYGPWRVPRLSSLGHVHLDPESREPVWVTTSLVEMESGWGPSARADQEGKPPPSHGPRVEKRHKGCWNALYVAGNVGLNLRKVYAHQFNNSPYRDGGVWIGEEYHPEYVGDASSGVREAPPPPFTRGVPLKPTHVPTPEE